MIDDSVDLPDDPDVTPKNKTVVRIEFFVEVEKSSDELLKTDETTMESDQIYLLDLTGNSSWLGLEM